MNKQDDSPIQVALSIDFEKRNEEYEAYLSALAASILSHTDATIIFHIFHTGNIPRDFKKKLENFLHPLGASLQTHKIKLDPAWKHFQHLHFWSPAILFKFYFPEVLNIPKVIFFDLDIICKKDIQILWNIDMQGYDLAGVPYKNSYQVNREFNSYEEHHTLEGRVNGGMIIIHLDRIRKRMNLREEALHFLKEYPDVKGIDEVVFCHLFGRETLLLPSSYQHFLGLDGALFDEENPDLREKIFCMHYAHQAKPFAFVNGEPDYYFWKAYAQTPFFDEKKFKAWHHRIGLQKAKLRTQARYFRSFFEMAIHRDLIIFGTGVFAKKLAAHLKEAKIPHLAFASNAKNEWGENLLALPILSPDEIRQNFQKPLILIGILNDKNNEVVKSQLECMGFQNGTTFFEGKLIFEDIGRD